MKILITTFSYPPNKDGVAEACRTMAEALAGQGWEVWVATSMGNDIRPENSEEMHQTSGGGIVDFNFRPDPADESAQRREIERYQEFVIQGRFDLIVNQCWEVPTTRFLQPILASIKARRVMVSHGYPLHIYQWQPRITMGLGQWLRGLRFTLFHLPKLVRSYDCLVFLSTMRGFGRFFDQTISTWLHHPGIEVIANGINLDQFPETELGFRARHGIGEGPMVLCVANYSERKNQCLAVRAFREANIPEATLVLIGSEFNESALKAMKLDRELSKQHHHGKVLFLEKLDREETFAAYVACDIFFLTAKAETQPIVLIEAMAAAKPWLSTDTGCVSEMTGGLVRRSLTGLVEGLRTLCENSTLRQHLGNEGRAAAVKQHDAAVNAATFGRIVEQLVKS